MAAGELLIDYNQRLLDHYPMYLNFMAVLFALVIQIQTLNRTAMNQLRVAVIVFTINFTTLAMTIPPPAAVEIEDSIYRRISLVVYNFLGRRQTEPTPPPVTTAVAPPAAPETNFWGIFTVVYNHVMGMAIEPTAPILPVRMPPTTTARWWSSGYISRPSIY
ncbi:hypothetical protein L6452_33112 [Arctium lappa]|uniref:Uncharacterized protein n=1 Tax=Arctium lappa TaxID=4217 RepID=A0ACB8Z7N9_ARCLA|nr:hypothetical protein L6452_33112 [Arctium lappa]